MFRDCGIIFFGDENVHRTRLKQRIMESGLKQAHISKIVGVTSSTFSLYVNGKRLPDVIIGQKIARALGATVEELWPLDEAENGRA
ncbi:helix-turn-helix transcriptional regulator [Alicyclobacillus shizuokensis]|uniref:helix-turn-helix transcriptional regulator n=1 Tax=Alicyclobacillus shizuokensis TaxID=392014 RepID=UPI0008314900